MDRRQYLSLTLTGSIAVTAGCLTDEPEESKPPASETDGANGSDGDDGTPSKPDENQARAEYETTTVGGFDVPLVPVEEAYEWYQSDSAYILDARSERAYDRHRIEGARLSPASRPNFDHPVEDIQSDARIVTYCGCPHHLSSARAAELYEAGYTDVYAIDDGFGGWVERDYPTIRSSETADTQSYTITGRTDPAFDGRQVWLVDPETNQQYAATIESDGSFKLAFEFVDVDDETPVTLELPDRTVERTLGELAASDLRL